MMKCSGCNVAHYCSVKCQKVHWKNGHKATCEGFQKTRSIQVNSSEDAQRRQELACMFLDRLCDKDLANATTWDKPADLFDVLLEYNARLLESALSKGLLLPDTTYTMLVLHSSLEQAIAWMKDPWSSHLDTHLIKYDLNPSESQTSADSCLRRMQELHQGPEHFNLSFQIQYAPELGRDGRVSKCSTMTLPETFSVGDTVEVRGAGAEVFTVLSMGSARFSYMVCSSGGITFEEWCHNLRRPPQPTRPTIESHVVGSEALRGRAARSQYIRGIEDSLRANTGHSLQTVAPNVLYMALQAYIDFGTYFPHLLFKAPVRNSDQFVPVSIDSPVDNQKDYEDLTWHCNPRECGVRNALALPRCKECGEVRFARGRRARALGLVARSDLNGRAGHVEKFDQGSERFAVQINRSSLGIKSMNLIDTCGEYGENLRNCGVAFNWPSNLD